MDTTFHNHVPTRKRYIKPEYTFSLWIEARAKLALKENKCSDRPGEVALSKKGYKI